MSRPLRIEIENGLYHVTSRGWERRRIARDDVDREAWIELLNRVALRTGWRIFAWALMPNHWHLYLRTPQPNLSAGMHDLNSGYASRFNRRHRRSGSLLQGRFKAILVEDDSHAAELTRYIHLNPVRAGLVEHPQDYVWSSYRDYFSNANSYPWFDATTVLDEMGRSKRAARRSYRRFVEQGAHEPSPLVNAAGGLLLGSPAWVERMKHELALRPEEQETPALRALAWRPTIDAVLEAVSQALDTSKASILTKRRQGNDARIAALCLCRRLTDERVRDLAERFDNVSPAGVSKSVARGEARCGEDRRWKRLLDRLESQLRAKRS